MLRRLLALSPFLWPAGAAPCAAQDWPHWRGPNYDGSTEAAGLPLDFSKSARVAWRVDMPGPSAATPIVSGERVFVASTEAELGALLALCLDRRSGEILWEDAAGSGYRAGNKGTATELDERTNYASPSPVTDGERVFFFFGNGDLVAYDFAGKRLWARNLQKERGDFAFQWTFSASPTLFEGKLFLPVLQRDEPANGLGRAGSPSFLLALDPQTGKTLYEHVRPSEAVMESRESYATAIPLVGAEQRKELLVLGGDVLTGHDPATGAELWRWGSWNPGHRETWWRIVPTPVVGDGVALVCAPKRAPVFAIRPDGWGALGEEALLWKSEGRRDPLTSDVPTPLFYRGRFFVLSDMHNSLTRVEPRTGAVEWTLELPGKALWRASPTGADGKVWLMNHAGLVVVVDAEKGELLAGVPMGEEDDDRICSSLAVAHGRLFVRTNSSLFCVGG